MGRLVRKSTQPVNPLGLCSVRGQPPKGLKKKDMTSLLADDGLLKLFLGCCWAPLTRPGALPFSTFRNSGKLLTAGGFLSCGSRPR